MSAVDSGQFVHEQVRAGNSRRNLSLPIPESECETGRMNDAQCQDGDELDDRTLHGRYTDATRTLGSTGTTLRKILPI